MKHNFCSFYLFLFIFTGGAAIGQDTSKQALPDTATIREHHKKKISQKLQIPNMDNEVSTSPSPYNISNFASALLPPSKIKEDVYGCDAYLVFNIQPNRSNDKLAKLYQKHLVAFFSTFSDIGSVKGLTPDKEIAVTYVPVQQTCQVNNPQVVGDANVVLQMYNYAIARTILHKIDNVNNSSYKTSSKQGPLLVAMRKPFTKLKRGDEILVLDLSLFSDTDLPNVYLQWQTMLQSNPKTWIMGFQPKLIKQYLTSFIKQYGGSILHIVHIS